MTGGGGLAVAERVRGVGMASMKALSSQTTTCQQCSATLAIYSTPVGEVTAECKCRRTARADDYHRWLYDQQVTTFLNDSGLGRRFRGCSFANWEPRPGAEKALEACRDYMRSFTPSSGSPGLLLLGRPGTGKSHLAAAVANHLLERCYSVRFWNVPRELAQIRACFSDNRSWDPDETTRPELLILDDLGAERWSEWVQETIYSIVDGRYQAMKPLLVTTNCELDDLRAQVNERIMDRLVEMCRVLEVKCDSYRRLRAKERLAAQREGMA